MIMVAISENLEKVLPLVVDRCRFSGRKLSLSQYVYARQKMPELGSFKLKEGRIRYSTGDYRSRLHYGIGKRKSVASVEVLSNKNGTYSFLYELWPHRCTLERFREFHSAVTGLLVDDIFDYEDVFNNGHVQRIEYAIDFIAIPVDSFLAWTPRGRLSNNYQENSSHTEQGTRYIGSRRSPLCFKSYDKAKEMEKYGLYNEYPIRSRIETTAFEPKIPGSLVQRLRPSQLNQLTNPFQQLEVADLYKVVELPLTEDLKWFLGLALYDGAAGAFQSALGTRKERLEVRQMLRQCAAPWWNSDQAWEGHEQANAMISPKHLLLAN